MQLTIKLPGSKRDVEIRSISTVEKDLLTNPVEVKSGRAIRKILKNCLLTPNIDLETLLTCDYNALVLGLRRATYGDNCDFIACCPFCHHGDTYTADLSQLPVRQGDRKIVEQQLKDPKACHPYTLPECGRTVRFRLECGEPKPYTLGKVGVETLQRLVVAVDGLEKTGTPVSVFLKSQDLSDGDTSDFLNYYEGIAPGIDDEMELNCTKCGMEFPTKLLLDAKSFFRRSKKKICGRQNSA